VTTRSIGQFVQTHATWSTRDPTLQVVIKPSGKIGREGYVTTASEKTFARTFGGQGADGDIVVASTRAYVSALNKMIHFLVSNQSDATSSTDSSSNNEASMDVVSETSVPAVTA
jgi:hypothetical protein